jgi:hypothetical protein
MSLSPNNGSCFKLLFPVATNVIDLSRYKDANSDLYVYTEAKGNPTVNYCEKCCKPYYLITSVNNSSIMNTKVRVSRCDHASGVTSYLMYINGTN